MNPRKNEGTWGILLKYSHRTIFGHDNDCTDFVQVASEGNT